MPSSDERQMEFRGEEHEQSAYVLLLRDKQVERNAGKALCKLADVANQRQRTPAQPPILVPLSLSWRPVIGPISEHPTKVVATRLSSTKDSVDVGVRPRPGLGVDYPTGAIKSGGRMAGTKR